MDKVLDPGEVGVPDRRCSIPPADVVAQQTALPVTDVERRIGEDEISAQIRVKVAPKRIRVFAAQVRFDAADGEVHLTQLPRGRIRLLPEDRQPRAPTAVSL